MPASFERKLITRDALAAMRASLQIGRAHV